MLESIRSRILFLAIIWSVIQNGFAQNYSNKFSVTVNQEFTTIKAEVLKDEKKIEAISERTYLWYAYRKIVQTTGGYDGRLLDGFYKEFYLNDQLFTKGQIKMGLKNKEWRSWYPDGTLKEIIVWKNGVKHGAYEFYNDYGKIVAKGRFRHNKLHARFYTYNMEGKVISKKRYRNGNEILEKVRTEVESEPDVRKDKKHEKKKRIWFKSKGDRKPGKKSENKDVKIRMS